MSSEHKPFAMFRPKKLIHPIIFCLLIWITNRSEAQQDPYFSHYGFIPSFQNPAFTGGDQEDGRISLVHHRQWRNYNDETWLQPETGVPIAGSVGLIKEVDPVTSLFNITQPLYIKGKCPPVGGIGFSMLSDKLGFMKRVSALVQLSLDVSLSRRLNSKLTFGLNAGLTNVGLEPKYFRYKDPFDPRIPIRFQASTKSDFGFGFLYHQCKVRSNLEDFYLGISGSHLNQPDFNITSQGFVLVPHFFVNQGITVKMNQSKLLHTVQFRYGVIAQFEVTEIVQLRSGFSLGTGFRVWKNSDALITMAGFKLGQTYIGYSYDVTLSKISTVSSGTHEILLSRTFQPFRANPCTPKWKRGTRSL
ncbi:MAG: type IX secretion system membrane protein PorP/SprF [Bacteroidetes bacterium]|nr:type IX secretion system membrane protein PorP/SprF [Bacteroidota bacterium]